MRIVRPRLVLVFVACLRTLPIVLLIRLISLPIPALPFTLSTPGTRGLLLGDQDRELQIHLCTAVTVGYPALRRIWE